MEYGRILQEILKDIKPTEKPKEVEKTIKKINHELKQKRISAKAVVGGSFAKNTHLKNKYDIDIFVMFSLKYNNKDISKLLEQVLKKFKPKKVHGSRDYYQINEKRLTFEVVPVLHIKKAKDAQNVTDFSPKHVEWVKKNVKKLHNEIRLAKRFCQAQGVYGAESYIRGFSGHVIDILIIYYKGFIPLLRASLRWKPKQVIDFYNIYKGEALKEMNYSKIQSPLIVVDPVQSDRNAASALSPEKLRVLKAEAEQFLKNPSEEYFKDKKMDIKALKKKNALIIEVSPETGKTDVVGSKILKVFEIIKKELAEFRIIDAEWQWDKKGKALLWFLLGEKELPIEKIQPGPPLNQKNNVHRFKEKHKNTFVRDGRIHAKVKRSFIKPRPLLRTLFKKDIIKERVKKCLLKS